MIDFWIGGTIVVSVMSLLCAGVLLISAADTYRGIQASDARLALKLLGLVLLSPMWPALILVSGVIGIFKLWRIAEYETLAQRRARKQAMKIAMRDKELEMLRVTNERLERELGVGKA